MKINDIYANKESFRSATFKDVMSVVLADITEDSTDKDSRNGLGKTLLVEVINFCLGSGISSTLSKDELKGWIFGLKVEINGASFNFERPTALDTMITISGDLESWPMESEGDSLTIKVEDFKRVLGEKIFGISYVSGKTHQLTYRNLMSYFMRTHPTAFVDPFKYLASEKALTTQMANAYLLGLNNEYSYKFFEIETRKKLLSGLQKAATAGMLDEFTGDLGDLEAGKVRLKQKVAQLQEKVASFRVHEEYYSIQDEANEYTRLVHKLVNEINLYEQTIVQYQESITHEKDISVEDVALVYKDAGVHFSDQLKRKLSEVEEFHRKVVLNRSQYLKDEMSRLRKLIHEKKMAVEKLSRKKEEAMTVLNSHGALDEFSQLQNRVTLFQQQLDDVNIRIDKLNEFNSGMSRIAIEIQELVLAMRQDYNERLDHIEEIITIFNNNSEELYSEPATLSIDITNSGYKFGINVLRASSGGVMNMKVFCYDLLIAEVSSRLKGRPIPLVHDSRIFDGVDERQIAKALKLAYKKAKECGFQYICTINSDDVPYEQFDPEFKRAFDSSVVMTYNDSDPASTLLGFRF